MDIDDLNDLSIEQLNNILKKNNNNYRTDGFSEISDERWDDILELISKKENKTKEEIKIRVDNNYSINNNDNNYSNNNDNNDNNENVNDDNNNDIDIINITNFEFKKGKITDLYSFVDNDNEQLIVTDKLDGICIIFYKDKCFTKHGKDKGLFININIFEDKINLQGVKDFTTKHNIALRCEFLIKKELFNSKYCDDFTNIRSLSCSIINKKNINKEMIKDFDLIIHSISDKIFTHNDLKDELKLFDLRKNLIKSKLISIEFIKSKKNMDDFIKTQKNNSDYDTDGLVFNKNIIEKRNTKILKSLFALKQNIEFFVVIIKNIEWKQGQNKRLTPIIIFQSSIINNGTCYTKCTGKNYSFLVKYGIGIGSIVKIRISGFIIPEIFELQSNPSTNLGISTFLNITIKEPHIYINEINDDYYVMNIIKFYKNLEIKNIGETIIKKIINECKFKHIKDFLDPINKEKILNVSGVSIKTYNVLISPIDKIYDENNLLSISPYFIGINKSNLTAAINNNAIIINKEFKLIINDNYKSKTKLMENIKKEKYEFEEWLYEFSSCDLINFNFKLE